jgi:hypothetical protein
VAAPLGPFVALLGQDSADNDDEHAAISEASHDLRLADLIIKLPLGPAISGMSTA